MATCPHCGVLLEPRSRTCDRCGAPPSQAWSDPRSVPEPAPFQAPPDWVEHRDPWRGFRVWHPRAFRLLRRPGPLQVTPDGGRRFATYLWPMALRSPEEAGTLAARFVQWKQQGNPRARAFVAPPDPSGQTRLHLVEDGAGEVLETRIQIRADGRLALLVGVQAPRGADRSLVEALGRVGASFAPLPALSRSLWEEPTERAFAVQVPAGWLARGGVARQGPAGLGTTWFEAWGEPTGRVRLTLSSQVYQFMDPGPGGGVAGAVFGLFAGVPPLTLGLPAEVLVPYQTAESFVRQRLLSERRRQDPQAALVSGQDRQDLVRESLAELARQGVHGARVSVGDYLLRLKSAEAAVLEWGRVRTLLVPVPTLMPGAPQPWMAEIPQVLQAPEAEFAALEPVLEGVAESCQVNPRWQASQQAAAQGYAAASQADRQRRLGQISRTLSETSDLVANSYWERQAITDHLGHDWSNAILGYEDRVSDSGQVFNVPTGYDRVFRDPQGNFLGGGWLVDPDPTWQELHLR